MEKVARHFASVQHPSGWKTPNPAAPEQSMTQRAAILAVTAGRRVVYAIEMPDGAIKIGCTVDLPNRLYKLKGDLLAFRFGGFADEHALHVRLIRHLVRGREYFEPHPNVMAVVDEMREALVQTA